MTSVLYGIALSAQNVPAPGALDRMGLFRIPVMVMMAAAAVIIVVISVVSVIRRK